MAADDSVVSGKYGCAKIGDGGDTEGNAVDIFEVTAWNYSEQAQDQTYASCQTDGQTSRIDGSTDMTGSISIVANVDNNFRDQVAVNDTAILYLYKRKPMVGVTGVYDRIPAKILGISGGADIEAGGAQRWEITWGQNVTQADPAALFDQTAAALV